MQAIIDLGTEATAFINGSTVRVESESAKTTVESSEKFLYSSWEQVLFNHEIVIKNIVNIVFDF